MSLLMGKALLLLSASFFILLSEAVVPQHPPPPHAPPPSYPHRPPPRQTSPIRTYFAVQGDVYCRQCLSKSFGTLIGGAVVELRCNGSTLDPPMKTTNTTDVHGHFKLEPKNATTYGSRKYCKVFFVSTPHKSMCQEITNINNGLVGAALNLTESTNLYTVGPFVAKPRRCLP